MQYEQLIDTIENIFKVPSDLVRPPSDVSSSANAAPHDLLNPKSDEFVQDIGNFEINEQFKRRLFINQSDIGANAGHTNLDGGQSKSFMQPKVSFELPIFIIQLKNEMNNPLIEVSFRDFKVNYERKNLYETNIQVSWIFFFKFLSICEI